MNWKGFARKPSTIPDLSSMTEINNVKLFVFLQIFPRLEFRLFISVTDGKSGRSGQPVSRTRLEHSASGIRVQSFADMMPGHSIL
jgi:hypothetical protein